MAHIIIIGGHGKVALHLARVLTERGNQVTSLVRNPDHFADVQETGATPTLFSIEDASTQEMTQAFQGADAVVWSAGAAGKGGAERTFAVDRDAAIRSMDAAEAAGARRYVMVSWMGSRAPLPMGEDHPLYNYGVAKLEADQHLAASNLEWTILGPGVLTTEPASGHITVGMTSDYGVSASDTSRENVALTIAAVLADSSSIGKILPLMDGDTPIAEAVAAAPEDGSVTR